jgi:Zn-finger nucleic acid-binding protein
LASIRFRRFYSNNLNDVSTLTDFMQSPIYSDSTMSLREIEPGLTAYECPKSGGFWIPLQSYTAWQEKHPSQPPDASVNANAPMLPDDSGRRALICPESGRLLLRYRVGHGLQFHIDRSPATGGVWLDKGEWEALKSKGLHSSLHLIFTASYQRHVRSSEYDESLKETFRDRIGAQDFAKVAEFGSWLTSHPKRRDICCYLMDNVEGTHNQT